MYYKKRYVQSTIDNEIASIKKPFLYEHRSVPLYLLNDREFEILTYYLFKKEFVHSKNEYDSIDLMKGVAEQGRDCVLYKDNKQTAVVQCKHSERKTKMDKPSCAKEILKFILNDIKYNIIDDKKNIKYFFVHSEGFTGPAQQLLNTFNTSIFDDIDILKKWINEICQNYMTLKDLKYNKIELELSNILKTLKVEKMEKADIEFLLFNHTSIIDMFFAIKKVVSDEVDLPRVFEDSSIPNNKLPSYYTERFVKQLKEIKCKKSDTDKAINDHWRMSNTFNWMIEKDFIPLERLQRYESDLCDKFNLEYDNACEFIDYKQSIESNSRKFYRTIMKMDPIKVIDMKHNRPFFQRGYYHDLVNSKSIDCWKLEPYEDGDIDE